MAAVVNDASALFKFDASGDIIRQGDADVTYSFLDALGPRAVTFGNTTFDSLLADNPGVVEQALWMWSDVAAIEFTLVADSSTVDIRFGATDLSFGVLGITYRFADFPDGTMRPGVEIYLDSGFSDLSLGSSAYLTLVHEIGHGLGLGHPEDLPFVLAAGLDSERFTVMSNDGFPGANVHAMAPMVLDIDAVQAIYGPNTTTRTGDTTYGFHSNATFDDSDVLRPDYDFAETPAPVTTIYDAGGTDTIDASLYATPVTLDLEPGALSSVGGLTRNLGIAFDTTIENAVGGTAGDLILGNAADNRLEGRGGDDVLAGKGGADSLAGGGGSDILAGGDGGDALAGGDGRDFLIGGAGGDTLSGDADRDIFIFRAGDGADAVDDFDAGPEPGDVLVLKGFGLAGGADLLDAVADPGPDLVLEFDGATSITLVGVSLDDLSFNDVFIV